MENKIYYRVWDYERQQMYEVKDIYVDDNEVAYYVPDAEAGIDIKKIYSKENANYKERRFPRGAELMYGLKIGEDVIYVNDIVEVEFHDAYTRDEVIIINGLSQLVYARNGGFWEWAKYKKIDKISVLGNKYQDPDIKEQDIFFMSGKERERFIDEQRRLRFRCIEDAFEEDASIEETELVEDE